LHDTDRLAHLGVEPAKLARAVPAGFIGDADDFGAVAAFLCSEPARYVTGVSVPVDGGVFVGLQ
jgi:3-oxoacyl-[acyl-carrier protein] reductase